MTPRLRGKTIAISISESPDLASLGFGLEHLTEALFETARQVVLQGATVAYGGDLRPGGFTEQLAALAQTLERRDEPMIRSYLAWPLYTKMMGVSPQPSGPSPAPEDLRGRERALRKIVRMLKVPEATLRVADPMTFLPPTTLENREIWARNLTAMREQMAKECDARAIMGGQIENWVGALPGVVEEAVAMLDAKKPLYVLGAFGGAARVVFDALAGAEPPALTAAFHARWYSEYPALASRLRPQGGPSPLEHAAQRLKEVGLRGLNNGLTDEENRRLATAVHLPELLALLLKGLLSVAA